MRLPTKFIDKHLIFRLLKCLSYQPVWNSFLCLKKSTEFFICLGWKTSQQLQYWWSFPGNWGPHQWQVVGDVWVHHHRPWFWQHLERVQIQPGAFTSRAGDNNCRGGSRELHVRPDLRTTAVWTSGQSQNIPRRLLQCDSLFGSIHHYIFCVHFFGAFRHAVHWLFRWGSARGRTINDW